MGPLFKNNEKFQDVGASDQPGAQEAGPSPGLTAQPLLFWMDVVFLSCISFPQGQSLGPGTTWSWGAHCHSQGLEGG